jgi:hypothetical protein
MYKYNKIIVFLFGLGLIFSNFYSQQKENHNSIWKKLGIISLNDTLHDNNKGFFFSPILFYTPDTRLGGGGAGVFSFHLSDKNDSSILTRTSYVRFLGNYTMNKQTDVWTDWNIFTRGEKFLFKGEFRYRNFPDWFYGIGNTTLTESKEKYTYNLLSFKTLVLYKFRPNWFVGLDYHLENEYKFQLDPSGQLINGEIIGYQGGVGSALGFVKIFDSRDNNLNPYKGTYFEASSYFYLTQLSSTFTFVNVNLMYNKYWQVKENHIIAFQTKTKFTFGDVPFLDMSSVGGDDILRGYPKNRFKDRNFVGTQIEYRFPLFWRFGMTTFAGVGDVFSNTNDLKLQHLKYSIGSGLRFVINPKERVNLRFDYAIGKEGGYFYFSVTEAF